VARQERSKKSTVSNSIATFQSANEMPKAPVELSADEGKFFEMIVRSREVTTWSDWDLMLAANMAMVQVQYAEAMANIKRDGRTLINDRGTPITNPETGALNQLSSSLRAFTAQLGLAASQRGISGDKQASRNQAEVAARKVIQKAAADDLLA